VFRKRGKSLRQFVIERRGGKQNKNKKKTKNKKETTKIREWYSTHLHCAIFFVVSTMIQDPGKF
jgi:hypothetical protein